MRKFIVSGIIILSIFYSCKKEKATIIQGKIIQPAEELVLLRSSENDEDISDTAKLDKEGNYFFRLMLEKPSFYQIRISNDLILDVFLTPGDELTLNVDMTQPFDQIKFSGKGEILNNFMIERVMSDKYQVPSYYNLLKMSEDEFRKTMDSILEFRTNDLENFCTEISKRSEKEIKSDDLAYFKKIYHTNLLFDYAMTHLIYRNNLPQFINQKDYRFSSSFDNYLKKLDLNNEEQIPSRSFRYFLKRYINYMVDPEYEKDTVAQRSNIGYNQMRYKKARSFFTSKNVTEFVLFNIMMEQVKFYGIKEIDQLMKQFEKDCKNKTYLSKVKEEIKKWDKIAPGKPAPVFSYPDTSNKMISLSDFKGKLVYIDVWASWCGPCKREIPHFIKLAKEYEGKNIIFLQISVDDTEEDWRAFKKTGGKNIIQLYAGGVRSKIAEDYIIRSIPRFLLIDTKGNIIDINAPVPSDPKIKGLLETYLSSGIN